MMFLKPTPKIRKLEKRILDLESELESKSRIISILESERDSLAAVCARDRQRVHAECAVYSRQRADNEGVIDERNPNGT